MKYILILSVLTIASITWGQNYNDGMHRITSPFSIEDCSNWSSNNLKGKVFSVDTKGFYSPVPKENIDSIINANSGRPGPFYHKKQYFDSIGREIKTIQISDNFGVEYRFDSLGHLSTICNLIGEYNRNTGEGRYGEYFSIDSETRLEWTTNGNRVIGTAKSDIKKDSIVYTHDENKNIIRIETSIDNVKQPVYQYSYDSLNRIISSKYFNRKGLEVYNWYYTFNDQGLLTSWVKKDTNANVLETMNCTYDTLGNSISNEIKSSSYLTQNEYEFEYDDKGNWILCSTIQNGKVVRMIFREINYFE